MKIYMVVAESWFQEFGSIKNCIGCYESKEDAERVLNEYHEMVKKEIRNIYLEDISYRSVYYNWDITFEEYLNSEAPNNAFYKAVYENIEAVGCIKEIEINKTYPMVSKFDWNRANRYFVNDMELGGYIE